MTRALILEASEKDPILMYGSWILRLNQRAPRQLTRMAFAGVAFEAA